MIATGVTHSVREFAEAALNCAQLPGALEDYINFDEAMIRPAEVDLLIGNASKAEELLGWKAKTNFQELVNKMVHADLKIEST